MKTYLSILLFLLAATAAHAGTIVWDGSNDPFWGNDNNWQGPVPAAVDDVVFDDTALGFTVNLGSESRAASTLAIDSATAYTFENQSGTPLLTLTLGDVTVSNGTNHLFDVPIVLASDATYAIATGADLAINGIVSGTNSLTKTGDGQLILGWFSPSVGDTIINAGSIRIGNQSALQYRSVKLNVDGGLETNGHLAYLGSLAGSGDFDTNGAGVTVGLDDADTTYSGTLTSLESGSYLELIEKIGDGTWTLTGADYHIETGFYVSDGHVIFDGVNGVIEVFAGTAGTDITFRGGASLNIGEADTTTIEGFTATDAGTVLNFGSIRYSGEMRVENGASVDVGSLLDFNGGVLIVDGGTVRASDIRDSVGDGGTMQLSDPSGDTALTLDLASDATFSGVISDYTNGPGSIVKNGTGILSLGGDNTYSGDTVINQGAIFITPDADDATTSLQNSTVILNVDNGLRHDELSEVYIGALSGSGDYDAKGSYVEVGANNASTTYSGNFTHESLGLRKEGTGTWTLAGNDLRIQEFSVGDGAVVFDGAGGTVVALRSAYQPLIFQNGTDMNVVNLGGSDITIDRSSVTVRLITPFTLADTIAISDPDGGTALTFNSDSDREVASTIIDHASGPGSIKKLAANTLTLTGENTFTGGTTISDGRIVLGNALALQNSAVEFDLDHALDLNGHDATFGGLEGNGALALGTNTITVGGNNRITRYDGVLSGTGGLIKEGSEIWLLGGNNTFSGDTLINEGGIYLTPDGSDRNYSLQNSTVHINVDNGLQHDALNLITLGALAGSGDYNASNPMVEVGGNNASTTYSGNLNGASVTVRKEGTGTWTLGGTVLDLSELVVVGGAVVFDGAGGTVTNLSSIDRPITFQNGADLQIGNLSGSSITINGGAMLTVTGYFTLSNGGTLVRTVGDASTLDIMGTATLAGTIQVLFPDDYTPPVGEPLTLCTFGSMGAGDPVLDASALPAGYAYALEVISAGATSSLALVVDYAETAEGFRLQYGLALDGSEDGLDDSGNGIANIFYYVFGLGDPAETDIDRSRLPTISTETGNLVFTFVRPTANDTGLEINVITSGDLEDWSTPDELGPDYLPVSETTEPLDDDYSTVTQVYPIQIDEDQRFYRVVVAQIDGL